jgi:hypothetical protein
MIATMPRALRSGARIALPIASVSLAVSLAGCRDLSRFSTGSGHYEGTIIQGSFVRAGLPDDARLCLTLDADHLQDTPGEVTTSDGLLQATALRPIPQIWHDPLSTLSFGEGRARNLIYVVTPSSKPGAATAEPDAFVFLSLMQSGGVEARLIRGAPAAGSGGAPSLFGVFTLTREDGPCSF